MDNFDRMLLDDFIENCLTILKGKETKLYKYQQKILSRLITENKIVVLKARQMGMSSLFMFYALFKTILSSNYSVVIMLPNANEIRNWKRTIMTILNNINRGKSTRETDSTISLDNGSTIKFFSARFVSRDVFPMNIHFLYFDEYQFFPSDEQLLKEYNISKYIYKEDPNKLTSDLSRVLVMEQVIIASTAGKKGTNFHKLWKENKNGIGEFYPIKLKWNANENVDEKWMEAQKISLGKKFFKSEFECKFVN